MKNTKLIAILLCVSMLLAVLVGCNTNDGSNVEETTVGTTETTTEAIVETTEATSEVLTTEAETETETESEAMSDTDTTATETETTTVAETETTAPETETTTEEETTVIEYDYESKFVSFVSYKNETSGAKQLTSKTTLAGKFNVTSGYLEQINVFMGTIGDVTFSLYRWNKDYDTTIAGEPLKQKTYLKSEYAKFETVDMLNLELEFEEGEVGKGSYLYVLSTPEGSTSYATIYMGVPWSAKTLSDEYKTYAMSSFVNGKKNTNEVPQSSYVFSAQVEKTEDVEMPVPTEKDPDGTVKVILIGGQSNAVGVSQNSELRKKISAEKYQEYLNGYSNVQIMYDNCSGNANSTFVNTKLGQAVNSAAFGPELGLAEYLATNFPEEQFYIIKYAMGGSILETQWYNAATGKVGELLTGFTAFVNKGLAEIESKGLTPKIIGFVWNQGESDAIWLPQSSRYYANQEGLVNYVRETFANYASVKGIGFFDAGIVGNIWNAYKNVNMQKYEFSLTSPINFYIETTDYEIINTLEENNDVAHYDSLGMIKLGQLYGEEIAKILN